MISKIKIIILPSHEGAADLVASDNGDSCASAEDHKDFGAFGRWA